MNNWLLFLRDYRLRHPGRRGRTRGFTLLELLVVVAVMGVLFGIGMPAFESLMIKAKLDGDVMGLNNLLQRVRQEAIRRGTQINVVLVTDMGETPPLSTLEFYTDIEDNKTFDGDDEEVLQPYYLTGTSTAAVQFWSAEDDNPNPEHAMKGFTDGILIFESDGSVRDLGSIRLGYGAPRSGVTMPGDYKRNFMEVRFVVAATSRTEVRKFVPDTVADLTADADDLYRNYYEPKKKRTDGSWNWEYFR